MIIKKKEFVKLYSLEFLNQISQKELAIFFK